MTATARLAGSVHGVVVHTETRTSASAPARSASAAVGLFTLKAAYTERSVDSPRVAYVPSGFVEVEGQQVDGFEHVNGLLTELRGSGSLALPNDRDAKGQREYEIDLSLHADVTVTIKLTVVPQE